MAKREHIEIFEEGVKAWNNWREKTPEIVPDLSEADLHKANINDINLYGTNLREADLNESNLIGANLREANLAGTNLHGADLRKANLSRAKLHQSELHRWGELLAVNLSEANLNGANLCEARLDKARLTSAKLNGAMLRNASMKEADLRWAYLDNADISGADLSDANLSYAHLNNAKLCGATLGGADFSLAELRGADLRYSNLRMVNFTQANLFKARLDGADLMAATLFETKLNNASITGCRIYGISAWNLKLNGAAQQNLIITDAFEPEITVDNLEVAQFIYLVVKNEKLRNVINTMRTKTVLILGSFIKEEPGEKDTSKISTSPSIEILKDALRNKGFIPMVFNFKPPEWQHMSETVKTLALLSHFVLIDMSEPAGQYIEYAELRNIHTPIITIAIEGAHISKMASSPSEYWIEDEPIRYNPTAVEKQLPALLKDPILARVNKINERLIDDRSRQH